VHARREAGEHPARRPLVVGAGRRRKECGLHEIPMQGVAERVLKRSPDSPNAPESLSHLDWLESEAIHIMREVVAEARNPALLFSGGKDSIVMLRIAEKAFRPDRFPFPLLHIDTEHNFPEVIAFRDARAPSWASACIVRSVGDSIRTGRVKLRRPTRAATRTRP
jgi:3'-phosphoadenosine 5'-phosphosulfate sulfotransferase (PAPS reductase)/FAD synthetase